jgi:hypothetical protein
MRSLYLASAWLHVLAAPTGTMAMVLGTRIVLDTQGRLVAIEKLKEAHALNRQQSGAARPMASH